MRTTTALFCAAGSAPDITQGRPGVSGCPDRIALRDPSPRRRNRENRDGRAAYRVYAQLAKAEVEGARLALEEVNQSGGILGRLAQLLLEDSANDIAAGVAKTRQLIERDHVDFILGDVNSAVALATMRVTAEKRKLHIVTGGHTDEITGRQCSWNVFRICKTATMEANAIADTLVEKFGKRWFFLTPDYAYGYSLQAAFCASFANMAGRGRATLCRSGRSIIPIRS